MSNTTMRLGNISGFKNVKLRYQIIYSVEIKIRISERAVIANIHLAFSKGEVSVKIDTNKVREVGTALETTKIMATCVETTIISITVIAIRTQEGDSKGYRMFFK